MLAQPLDLLLIVGAYPYRARGFLCQRARVMINGLPAGGFFLDLGWHDYRLNVDRDLLRPGHNLIDFVFSYTDDSNWRGVNPQRKPLSVAFQNLRLVAD
jgi:hypothetical protein